MQNDAWKCALLLNRLESDISMMFRGYSEPEQLRRMVDLAQEICRLVSLAEIPEAHNLVDSHEGGVRNSHFAIPKVVQSVRFWVHGMSGSSAPGQRASRNPSCP